MRQESNIPLPHTPRMRVLEDPYVKIRVDSIDHDHLYFKEINAWKDSPTAQVAKYDNRSIVGSYIKSAPSSVNFTDTITLPTTGYYMVLLSYYARPKYSGSFGLYCDDVLVDDEVSLKSKYDQLSYKMYPPQYWTSGRHTFKITLSKSGFVRDIVIAPLIRFEGDNQGTPRRHDLRLDFDEVDFTQNSVAEMNTCNFTLPLRDEYLRDYDWYTPYVFDKDDMVTVWMGETRRDAKPMFGGYVSSVNSNEGELEIGCKDRLLDLDRVPLYKNFTLGGAKAADGSTRPFTAFPNVYELIRYLAEYSRYPIDCYSVPYDFAINNNFNDISEYNSTNVSVWNKSYDLKQGYPAPSLKLSVGSTAGTGSATLYTETEDPYDASTHNYLSLDYYASGCSAKNPLPFNLIINMHKKDETSANAINYTVNISNGNGTNVIGSYSPTLNGEWQRMTLNIDSLFDKKAPSANYYINSITLQGTVTSSMVTSNSCAALWIGGLYAYKSISHSPKYASQDVKSPYEEVQQVCERCRHAAYVVYGDSRDQDVLKVQPVEDVTASVGVDEDDNLLELESVDYDPLGDDFCNYRHMTFNFKNNKAGSGYKWDLSSMAHYREEQRHDFNSDVQTQADANTDISNYLADHKWPKLGFTVKVRGTGLLEPEQYAAVSIPSHRIIGNYPVKSITHNWSREAGYTTRVDFGKASNRFRRLVRDQSKELKNLGQRNTSNTYQTGTASILGSNSPGAFNDI